MACETQQKRVAELTSELRSLQFELTHGDNPDKRELISEIKELQPQLAAAQHALDLCTATLPPPLNCIFTGIATVGILGGGDPIARNVTAAITFDGPREQFTVTSFSAIQPWQVATQHGEATVTASVTAAFQGVFNRNTGTLNTVTPMPIEITISLSVFSSDSSAGIPLSTGTVTDATGELVGQPLTAGGDLTLVGQAICHGDQLEGKPIALIMAGNLVPNPLTA